MSPNKHHAALTETLTFPWHPLLCCTRKQVCDWENCREKNTKGFIIGVECQFINTVTSEKNIMNFSLWKYKFSLILITYLELCILSSRTQKASGLTALRHSPGSMNNTFWNKAEAIHFLNDFDLSDSHQCFWWCHISSFMPRCIIIQK